jgi:hypothetical protein
MATMLPQTTEGHSSFTDHHPLIPDRSQWKDAAAARLAIGEACQDAVLKWFVSSSEEETPEPDARDAPLEDAARTEREYLRQRLREELQRDPTEEELDEWLRQHTEGY